jgi:hypothetical protein
MMIRTLCCALLAMGVAACNSAPSTISIPNPMAKPQPDAPLWSATYNVPFTTMANCLATKPTGGFFGVLSMQPEAGVATVTLSLGDGTQMAINYIVRRTGNGTSSVEWRRLLTVGGFEWLDIQAHDRADACGGVS